MLPAPVVAALNNAVEVLRVSRQPAVYLMNLKPVLRRTLQHYRADLVSCETEQYAVAIENGFVNIEFKGNNISHNCKINLET